MNRRTTLLSLITSAFGVPLAQSAISDDLTKNDARLSAVLKDPHGYMFADQAIDRVGGKGFIKIHTVAPTSGGPDFVALRHGTVRFFRHDGTASADGKHAKVVWSVGENWPVGDLTNSTQFGTPGDVMMVVWSADGVLSWYSMAPDLRC